MPGQLSFKGVPFFQCSFHQDLLSSHIEKDPKMQGGDHGNVLCDGYGKSRMINVASVLISF